MINTKENKTFTQTIAAIAKGDEYATTELAFDIAPDLLGFANENGAHDAEALVKGTLVDALRNINRFSGSRNELIAVLCRVIKRRISDQMDSQDQATVQDVEQSPDVTQPNDTLTLVNASSSVGKQPEPSVNLAAARQQAALPIPSDTIQNKVAPNCGTKGQHKSVDQGETVADTHQATLQSAPSQGRRSAQFIFLAVGGLLFLTPVVLLSLALFE